MKGRIVSWDNAQTSLGVALTFLKDWTLASFPIIINWRIWGIWFFCVLVCIKENINSSLFAKNLRYCLPVFYVVIETIIFGSLTLEEATCCAMSIFKQLDRDIHEVRNYGFLQITSTNLPSTLVSHFGIDFSAPWETLS